MLRKLHSLLMIYCLVLPGFAQVNQPQAAQTPVAQPAVSESAAGSNAGAAQAGANERPAPPCEDVRSRHESKNGINVEEPKIFDDSMLQQQLEAAQVKLAGLQGFDQTSLTSHLGNVTGNTQDVHNFSANVLGPSIPGLATTTAQPNTQVVNTSDLQTTSAAAGSTTPSTVQDTKGVTTINPQTVQTVQTIAGVTPTAATPAAAPTAITSGFSVQSAAVLSEQLELQAQLESSLLLTEGALSDRLLKIGTHEQVKPRASLGFAITATPSKNERDSVAVVEVIIANCEEKLAAEPSVTAMLPSEKTYNVASVKSSTNNLGAGVATQLLGVSAGFLWGSSSYYLVRDQDTVAQVFTPSDGEKSKYCGSHQCTGIRWFFRPVLGQRFITPERREVIAQIAFPSTFEAPVYGNLTIRTYWRKFDRKTGLVGAVIESTKSDEVWRWPIEHYVLQTAFKFDPTLSEDLGNGLMLVRLGGQFMPGTYVRVGSSVYSDGAQGFLRESDAIRFVASESDLATKKTYVVFRSGEASELKYTYDKDFHPQFPSASVQAIDNANSRLSVQYCRPKSVDGRSNTSEPSMLLVVSGHSYGYADTPVLRQTYLEKAECKNASLDTRTISVTVPTATLLASPQVKLTALLDDGGYTANLSVSYPSSLTPFSQADHLVLLKQDKDSAEFLLYGNRLAHVSQVDPPVTLVASAGDGTHDDLRLVTLSAKQIGAYKFLVITRDKEAPEVIPIPAVTLPSGGDGNPPALSGRVVINADSATFTGKGLDDLAKVEFGKVSIPFSASKDGTSVILSGLKKAGVTSTAAIRSLDFYFKEKSVPVKIDVVTEKVETVSR